MSNPEWVVKALEFRGDYVLRLKFEDGSIKDFDCKELLDEPIYSSLRNMSFFRKARALYGTVRWNEEIDIAPEYLYEHGVSITEADKDYISIRAVMAMREMSEIAARNGLSDMTLDEINAEIDACRAERDSKINK